MAKGKKATPKAKRTPTKAEKAAKAATDKLILDQAAAMPVGQSKTYMAAHVELDEIEADMATLNKRKRGVHAKVKGMKINIREFAHIRKLRKMGPEDSKSFEAGVALQKELLGMENDPYQQALIKQIEAEREASREAMIDASGGETGKEIGSSNLGHNSANAKPPVDDDEDEEGGVPQENEDLRKTVVRL